MVVINIKYVYVLLNGLDCCSEIALCGSYSLGRNVDEVSNVVYHHFDVGLPW